MLTPGGAFSTTIYLIRTSYLNLKNSDGVVEHLHPDDQHFAALLGGGRRSPGAPVYAGRCRMGVMHAAAAGAATARKLSRRAAVVVHQLHCDGGPRTLNDKLTLTLNTNLKQEKKIDKKCIFYLLKISTKE